MERKINLELRRTIDNENDILIVLTDISKDNVSKFMKEYDLKDFTGYDENDTNEVSFYNKLIEDFDAEYDDDLADMIELLIQQVKGD